MQLAVASYLKGADAPAPKICDDDDKIVNDLLRFMFVLIKLKGILKSIRHSSAIKSIITS